MNDDNRTRLDVMVNRFLAWKLPDSVCSDPCATTKGYPNRTGTTLLTADEARQMLEHVLQGIARSHTEQKDNVPLRCEVVNGAIEFTIGSKILAHATNICPAHYDAENDRGRYRVTDHEAFAKDVVRALNHEREDGSTMLSQMMDAAVAQAIDEGAEGVEENNGGLDVSAERKP